jgi:tetratricopeptide (TPR) repeat protein
MDCARVASEEILEGYLVGRLTEEDREAFEGHFFECAHCFDDLRLLQAVQGGLRQGSVEVQARKRGRWFRWAPAAGLAAAAAPALAVLVLWMRSAPPSGPPEAAKSSPPPQVQLPDAPKPQPPPPAVVSRPSLEELARIEPARYEPRRFRDLPDEATRRFQSGMEHYRKADYAGAVADLREAARLDPDAPHIPFYLGISHLMLGHDDAAIDWLRATIALGDSPYREDAHFYLAKAFLRRNDLGAAEIQLRTLIELRGSGSGEAKRLLTQVERLTQRSP